MRTDFVFPAANGTYESAIQGMSVYAIAIGVPTNTITFEFYDNYENGVLSSVSENVAGNISLNGKMSLNSIWQPIPCNTLGNTVDTSNPLSVAFTGVLQRLQLINNGLTNTNWIKIILDITESK